METYVEPNKRCTRCGEQLYRLGGWRHLDGRLHHWQDLLLTIPALAGLVVMVVLGLLVLGAAMHATGMGSGYN